MNFEAICKAIQARWTANWTATATCMEGQPFHPPADAPWVRLTVRFLSRTQIDMHDTPRKRMEGLIVLQLFDRANKGIGATIRVADAAVPIFSRKQFDGITCRATDAPRTIGEVDGFYQINLETRFYADDISAD